MSDDNDAEPDLGLVAEVVKHLDTEVHQQGRTLDRMTGRLASIEEMQGTTIGMLEEILRRLPPVPQ